MSGLVGRSVAQKDTPGVELGGLRVTLNGWNLKLGQEEGLSRGGRRGQKKGWGLVRHEQGRKKRRGSEKRVRGQIKVGPIPVHHTSTTRPLIWRFRFIICRKHGPSCGDSVFIMHSNLAIPFPHLS